MDKLLHERLMEIPDGIGSHQVDGDGYSFVLYGYEAKALADEIERDYITRPRFEDSEPVAWDSEDIKWDDKYQNWSFNAIDEDGTPVAIDESTVYARAQMCNGFVVCKQPKVLDADGVEIKVGDTVWYLIGIEEDEEAIVRGFEDGKVKIEVGCQSKWLVEANKLTHKEPDSLGKLRDDILALITEDADDPESTFMDDVLRGYAKRLSALIERNAR